MHNNSHSFPYPDAINSQRGFTLIELSIVLVIIGLIVGGILVGQDLINAAKLRAQITQIEKFNTAVHAFQLKFNGMPGDITPTQYLQFGFTAGARSGGFGQGNGDGIIENGNSCCYWGLGGENLFIWEDLSTNSNLIEGAFNFSVVSSDGVDVSTNIGFAPYLPAAKLGVGNYVDVAEYNNVNYYQIIYPTYSQNNSQLNINSGMTVVQANIIDTKIDDGIPTTGNVLAGAITANYVATATRLNGSGDFFINAASSDTTTSCYNSTTSTYSMSIAGGSGVNCTLMFKFQ